MARQDDRKGPPRRRLSGAERRRAIVEAAAPVFADQGYAGATTQAIARRAGVSEALLYSHFPSKKSIYWAVLRDLLRKQDETLRATAHVAPDALALVRSIHHYLERCLATEPSPGEDMLRRVLATSFAGDGHYARLVYRRARRLRFASFGAALNAAREQLLLTDEIDLENAAYFVEHVGYMISLSRLPRQAVIPYEGDDRAVLRQALLFCVRGMGLPDHLIAEAGL